MFAAGVAKWNFDMARPEQIDHINTVNWFKHHYPELEDDFHDNDGNVLADIMQIYQMFAIRDLKFDA